MLLRICLLLQTVFAFNQNPKIYNQINTIEFVEPLVHGFSIRVPKDFVETQLGLEKTPIVYVSAIPLREELQSHREIVYRVINNQLPINNLEKKSWYYVCVEFENQHRFQRSGNFSTTCGLYRTLDKYGTRTDSMVDNVEVLSAQNSELRVRAEIDTEFPSRFDFYLENGPLVQSYLLSSPRSLSVLFTELVPGYNYGSICVRQKPLVTAYTSMGRSVHADISKCFNENLQTSGEPYMDNTVRAPQKRSALNAASTSVRSSLVGILSVLLYCVV